MFIGRRISAGCGALALLTLGFFSASARAQIGVALDGIGPVNRSMGGASVAAPLSSLGAIYWNPATMSGLQNELEFGTELLYCQTRVASTVLANSFGPGFPPVDLSGSDRGDNGAHLLPSIGLVYRPCDSRWTYGFGVYAAGGFADNYPASMTNPILTPQAPHGIGLGNLDAEFMLAQISPSIAYQVTDHFSVGFSPTIDIAQLTADPAFLVPPDNAAGTGFATYPSATHSRWTWGAGFQAGAYYTTDLGWNFGASIKSPQWFEPFRYNATDQIGEPRTLKFHFDYPLMASLGLSYTGFERWVLAADFRYVNYHDTPGFSHFGFDQYGAAKGLGFDDVFSVALGAQYKLTDRLALRCGYVYNTNPIPDSRTAFNVASPTIIEHTLNVGASYDVSKALMLSIAYVHMFQNSNTGPYLTPLGAVPGASVSTTVSADSLLVGATVRY